MHRDFRLIHHRNTSNHHFNLDKILLKFDWILVSTHKYLTVVNVVAGLPV
jgi:hypothetical protein